MYIDENWDASSDFYDALGGKPKGYKIKNAQAGGDDEELIRTVKPILGLWRCLIVANKF